jgi:hypothetical protein
MNKKNLILGGVLVILIILAFVFEGPFKTWKENWSKPDNFFANIDFNQINKISLSGVDEDITFVEVNDKWMIDGTKDFWLTETQVNNIQSALVDAKNTDLELVSENQEKKSEFMTDENGKKVELLKDDELILEFFLGKTGNDFSSTYVSSQNSDNTYLVKAALSSAFNQSNWYDSNIFDSEAEKIDKIRFQYPNESFVIAKEVADNEAEADSWKGIEPYDFNVKTENIEEIINIMSKLKAVEIPAQTFEGTGLENHEIIVQATGEGVDNTIMIGGEKLQEVEDAEPLYYAKKADSDNIYLISKEQRDELEKKIWQFR